jgi:hypothetical protein
MPTSWTRFKDFYGLRSPFNFNVAIPFILNIVVFTVILCVALFWSFSHLLSIGTARFYFFCYIACLLLAGAALSKVRTLSYAILAWCTLELVLGFGSRTLSMHGHGTSLFPRNVSTASDPWSTAFAYHPLLQFVPQPNWQYKDHLDFGSHADDAKTAGIDVKSLQGREIDFAHNSLGLRGKEPTKDDLAKDLIFVYGGSTTYDIGLTQGETWVEDLQSDLKDKYTLLNLGVPAHSTVQHLIDTAFYQDIAKKTPACAVYYIGWNDIINAHIKSLDNAYADYYLLLAAQHKPAIALAKYSPLLLFLNAMAVKRFDTLPLHPQTFGEQPVAGSDAHLEAIFVDHVKTIAAINQARSIKTIFIGQILNRNWPITPHYVPLIKQGEFVPLMERFKSVLKSAVASMPAKYIDPGITNFAGNDFVDEGHFAASGARKFATLVSKEVGDYCR